MDNALIPRRIAPDNRAGLDEMLSQESSKRGICFVVVESRDKECAMSIMARLERYNLTAPADRIFHYTSPQYAGSNHYEREEKIPEITDPGMTYICIDDFIDSGTTMGCTVKALESKGVPRGNIWFCVGGFLTDADLGARPLLEKAEVVMDYLRAHRDPQRPSVKCRDFRRWRQEQTSA